MIRLSGDYGTLFSGYQVAAILGKWELVRPNEPLGNVKSRVEAKVTATNKYWILQNLTRLSLKLGSHYWCWNEVTIVEWGNGRFSLEVSGDPVTVEENVMIRSIRHGN